MRGAPPSSSLPRGSGLSASRCPAPARDERPSGVGASAPFGAAISSAPCRAYVGKRNRCFRSASGMSSLDVGRERRLSFVDSVHYAGKTVLVMREMLPAGRSTNRDTPHQPSEPGAPTCPCGERWTRYTTCDSDARPPRGHFPWMVNGPAVHCAESAPESRFSRLHIKGRCAATATNTLTA